LWTPDNTLRASNKLQGGIVVKPAADEAMFSEDSLQLYKERAILAARENKVEDAAYYAELYVKYAAEPSFLESRYFHNVSQSDAFQSLIKSYSFRFDWINFFYLFSALTGFFIGTILLLKRGQDRVSKLLISTFVLIHSVFIFDIFLYNTNLRFKAPHVLYMSGSFSYLYGPLIYFYFKRITTKYQFQKWDLLHLLPTALAFLVLLPIYLLPESEKVKVMFNVGNFDRIPYLYGFVSAKIVSLSIYGFLIIRQYFKNKEFKTYTLEAQRWINALVTLGGAYVLSYLVYGMTISGWIPRSEFLYHLQIIAMAGMVLYIGYVSYLRPSLFAASFGKKIEKYTKSGLTANYSLELKSHLVQLLEVEKLYLQNDIKLDELADRLGTTRHNASQVINEHFGLNFFELINKYRIQDAVEILEQNQNRNIIDVAYEVGFNNKVTFNKSFKKFLSQTPSQYLGNLKAS